MSGLPQVEGPREGTFLPAPCERPKSHLLPGQGDRRKESGETQLNKPKRALVPWDGTDLAAIKKSLAEH